jgi:predicted O-methyltransferase YrrM
VESGTEKGLGSLIINRALEKNGIGQLYTLDIDIYAGSLFDAQDKEKINLVIGDSIESIGRISEIDFFIQDSNHSINHEILELEALEKQLCKNSIVISDNAHDSNALFEWSKKMGRNYIFINEQSKNHWYPGDGVGISINI